MDLAHKIAMRFASSRHMPKVKAILEKMYGTGNVVMGNLSDEGEFTALVTYPGAEDLDKTALRDLKTAISKAVNWSVPEVVLFNYPSPRGKDKLWLHFVPTNFEEP
jgi:hypothetical protein